MEPTSPALAGGFFTTGPPGKSHVVSTDHTYTHPVSAGDRTYALPPQEVTPQSSTLKTSSGSLTPSHGFIPQWTTSAFPLHPRLHHPWALDFIPSASSVSLLFPTVAPHLQHLLSCLCPSTCKDSEIIPTLNIEKTENSLAWLCISPPATGPVLLLSFLETVVFHSLLPLPHFHPPLEPCNVL